ncbi:hypothetical protein LOD99_10670 [Oopsacas minuta]|uniref:Kinase n=1 Tax=Oopsacas minuta TaxID=111878 RepID=A0AAV7KEG5_9METZ|nr:hypothetical protein LOD99_10670 [Oopsacas minuta]
MAANIYGPRNVSEMLSQLENGSNTNLSQEALRLLSCIPEGYIPLPHQIAGHRHTNGKEGLLRNIHKPQILLKPLVVKEIQFYQYLQSADASQDVVNIRKFVPNFHGIVQLNESHGSADYLALEDCVFPFTKASIVDLKIGKKFYDKGTDESKVLRTRVKYTVLEAAGFQIVGMRVFQPSLNEFKFYNIKFGQGLSDYDSANKGMLDFLDNGTEIRYDLVPSIIKKVTEIKNWFAAQTTFKLFATSILLIYEGSQTPGVDRSRVDIRLVDFAHTTLATEAECDPNSYQMAERSNTSPLLISSSGSDSETFPFPELTPLEAPPQIDPPEKNKKVQDMLSLVDQYCDTDGLSSEAIALLGAIPDGYTPVPHQMGGHKHVNGKPGFLRKIGTPEFLYKPVQPFPKGIRELNFYNFLQTPELTSEVLQLKKFLPKFYGTQIIPPKTSDGVISEYFRLEDCAHPFKKPSILDLKIGKKVCEQGSAENKIIRSVEKYPVQDSIGFRIVGMRVYKTLTDDYKYYNRCYGMTRLDKESVHQGMLDFLDNGTEIRYDLVPSIIEKVTEIKNWFAAQTTFKLFATSILLIYEGSQTPGVDRSRVDIRLVDFAHAYFSSEVMDLGPNCEFGAKQVLEHFRIIKESQF